MSWLWKKSLYLKPAQATLYLVNLEAWSKANDFASGPILNIHVVGKEDKTPPITLVDTSNRRGEFAVAGEFLRLQGVRRKIIGGGGGIAPDWFQDLPLRDRLQDMLKQDVARDYGPVFMG